MTMAQVVNDIILILALVLISGCIFYLIRSLNIYLDNKNDLLEKEIKNKKYEIFNSVDIVATKQIVEDMIDEYVNQYALYKFIAPNVIYVKAEQQQEMIRDVTRNIVIDLSELYIYYIKLLTEIDSKEDLVKYINTKVKVSVINFIANYNQSNQL